MPPASILPETAPFNNEQRAWLDGFLSGWLGVNGDGAQSAFSGTETGLLDSPPEPEVEEDFPWHDPAVPLDERLEMAEERPFERKLMAAMAQLDCGSCGYDCQKYAEAIANGEEKSLKLCSPGGSETAKQLKTLVKLNGQAPATKVNGAAVKTNGAITQESGYSRSNPFSAKLLAIRNLNGKGSAKHTSHVEVDLRGSGLKYNVGDSLGVYPTNCEELISEIIDELRASGDETIIVGDKSYPLKQALHLEFCLNEITDELLETMSKNCGDVGEANLLEQFLEDYDPIASWDVLDLLKHFPSARLSADQFTKSLASMKPRLYSISSSMKAHPDQVHLTVGRVSWENKERLRKGVASTMFSDRLQVGEEVRVFVQKSHGFTVPADPNTKMIMIGPGTGIAPFRAFLEERKATDSPGENWLFFGDQREATDFLYKDEFDSLSQAGVLSRIDTAFSRDQEQKIYVQDRIVENGQEIWNWIKGGAHLYVCGDAKRMAVDVENAFKTVIQKYGLMSETEAATFLKELQKTECYSKDVY